MKVAVVVLADTEVHEGFGRVVNALEAVKEFKELSGRERRGRNDEKLGAHAARVLLLEGTTGRRDACAPRLFSEER